MEKYLVKVLCIMINNNMSLIIFMINNYVLYVLAGCLPLFQSVRHGSKAVTRHRKPMHFLKQKLMAVTEYIPPKPAAPPGALGQRTQKTKEVSETQSILNLLYQA